MSDGGRGLWSAMVGVVRTARRHIMVGRGLQMASWKLVAIRKCTCRLLDALYRGVTVARSCDANRKTKRKYGFQ